MPLQGACDNTQKIRVDYQPKGHDRQGNEVDARVDGPITAMILSGDDTASVVMDPALPLQVQFLSGDFPGEVTFGVEADADLGSGIRTIRDTFTLTVSVPVIEADTFFGVVGNPEKK